MVEQGKAVITLRRRSVYLVIGRLKLGLFRHCNCSGRWTAITRTKALFPSKAAPLTFCTPLPSATPSPASHSNLPTFLTSTKHKVIMVNDPLKKRKIAVLGSRSVGKRGRCLPLYDAEYHLQENHPWSFNSWRDTLWNHTIPPLKTRLRNLSSSGISNTIVTSLTLPARHSFLVAYILPDLLIGKCPHLRAKSLLHHWGVHSLKPVHELIPMLVRMNLATPTLIPIDVAQARHSIHVWPKLKNQLTLHPRILPSALLCEPGLRLLYFGLLWIQDLRNLPPFSSASS
ncbi:hypothetical protein AG1IA_04568 [Rhizoctonia solani AG-1 IA]|uniref:Uncharacterized protein n=1 Tax=Thanatephorus cucumeris (strain AG1-IA) TaxID=983506 RepID=L8WX54_THACA|nr:hypothetical protein AG1IA_04568 [Rhizoctonia solani AG-1 IA]